MKTDEQALGARGVQRGKCATKVGKTRNREFEPIWWTIVAALTKFSWSGALCCRFSVAWNPREQKRFDGKIKFWNTVFIVGLLIIFTCTAALGRLLCVAVALR
jgi:hypothetical protein